MIARVTLLCAAVVLAAADVYMHNPRGSNNRYVTEDLDDNEVENADRLFDSQNNNDGGYDHSGIADVTKRMQYYAGSRLTIEWASQHGCGHESTANCEIIIQYMCSPPGTPITTPLNPWPRDGSSNTDQNFDVDDPTQSDQTTRGMHEPWYNYHGCQSRERNKGLFIADRNLNTDDARSTRQRNNGNNRNGLECPEERDYYPYWAPSEWRDVAVLTNDLDRCEYYWNNTQNTNPKYQCVRDQTYTINGNSYRKVAKYIDMKACQTAQPQSGDHYTWQETPPHFFSRADMQANPAAVPPVMNRPFWGAGDAATRPECLRFQALVQRGDMSPADATRQCRAALGGPLCMENRWQRDNHLGFVAGGYLANFTWLVPDEPSPACVLRLRYNISTDDYPGWTTDAKSNAEENDPNAIVYQDPQVKFMWTYPLELALNTNQYGRTFQDRSHTFSILARPVGVPPTSTIHNLNVRGKRGHLTQTYPSPSLSYVPRELHIKQNDYVHFQWEGASTVANNYFGGGNENHDRTNLVQIASMKSNRPLPFDQRAELAGLAMVDVATAKKLMTVGQDGVACKTWQQLANETQLAQTVEGTDEYYAALLKIQEHSGNCFALNMAPAYFGLELQLFAHPPGSAFYFMSTRSNFANLQAQKGAIYVH